MAETKTEAEQITVLKTELAKKDDEIKSLKAQSLKTEIDALLTYKDYDLKLSAAHADLATLRSFAAATKIEQHKALAQTTKKE